jgi:hypothetical protein
VQFISRSNSRKNTYDLNGKWVPDSIDWKNASFESLLIYDDTSFVRIASTNMLLKNDSIQLMTEPGFVLSSGTMKGANPSNKTVSYRTWLPAHEFTPTLFALVCCEKSYDSETTSKSL